MRLPPAGIEDVGVLGVVVLPGRWGSANPEGRPFFKSRGFGSNVFRKGYLLKLKNFFFLGGSGRLWLSPPPHHRVVILVFWKSIPCSLGL